MSSTTPYNRPLRSKEPAVQWFMVAVSLLIHVGLVLALAAASFVIPNYQSMPFSISVSEMSLDTGDLPPLSNSQEAGSPDARPPEAVTEAIIPEEPEIIEEPVIEPEPEREIPEEIPKELPKEMPKEEPEPEPIKLEPEEVVVSTNSKPVEKEQEPVAPPKPKPIEIAEELEEQRGTFKAKRDLGRATNSRYIASGDAGGGGGPALYRSVLISRIGSLWNPPLVPPGIALDATVEFTVYSPNTTDITRRSRVENIRIAISSGDQKFDFSAMEAIRAVRNWPPLPDSYKEDSLVVQCRFYLMGENR
jgi:TonB family protein